jgi:hypothetical protein
MQVDRGSKTALMQADLHVLSPEDDAATLTARVNEAWDAEYKTHVEESSFLRVCVRLCVYAESILSQSVAITPTFIHALSHTHTHTLTGGAARLQG